QFILCGLLLCFLRFLLLEFFDPAGREEEFTEGNEGNEGAKPQRAFHKNQAWHSGRILLRTPSSARFSSPNKGGLCFIAVREREPANPISVISFAPRPGGCDGFI